MAINLSMYLIKEPDGTINFWSVSDSEDQAWEDFRDWFTTDKDPETFQYCEDKDTLKSQGYSCIKVDLVGEVLP